MQDNTMSDISNPQKRNILKIIEKVLVFFGAVVCLVVVFLFASDQPNELWPFPGIYFLEITLLVLFGAGSRLFESAQAKPTMTAAPWITGGALLPFVILGAFTIGLFLIPGMLAFILSGIFSDIQQKIGYAGHISIAAMAALIQAALMIAVNTVYIP